MQLQLYVFVSKEALKVMACEIVPLQHFGSVRHEAPLPLQSLQQGEENSCRKLSFG